MIGEGDVVNSTEVGPDGCDGWWWAWVFCERVARSWGSRSL